MVGESYAKKVTLNIRNGVVQSNFEGFEGKACDVLAKKINPEELNIKEKELKEEYNFETSTEFKLEDEREFQQS